MLLNLLRSIYLKKKESYSTVTIYLILYYIHGIHYGGLYSRIKTIYRVTLSLGSVL